MRIGNRLSAVGPLYARYSIPMDISRCHLSFLNGRKLQKTAVRDRQPAKDSQFYRCVSRSKYTETLRLGIRPQKSPFVRFRVLG